MSAANLSAMVALIIIGGALLGHAVVFGRVPQEILSFIVAQDFHPLLLLLLVNVILFTSDLSESSVPVFEQTVMLALQLGASITMLHIIEDGSDGSQNRMIHLVDKEVYEQIRRQSRQQVRNTLIDKQKAIPVISNALEDLCNDASGKLCRKDEDVKIDAIEVRYGNAAEIITDFSASVDLVVMGYRKRGSLLRALVGSAGKNVLKHSSKPILLVPIP